MRSTTPHRVIVLHKTRNVPGVLCIAAADITYFTQRGFQINALEWMNEIKPMEFNIGWTCVWE